MRALAEFNLNEKSGLYEINFMDTFRKWKKRFVSFGQDKDRNNSEICKRYFHSYSITEHLTPNTSDC